MLDLAKVADLVLLLVDASYGFELETFEFINILQVHGFPRVIGVLTHLDAFRDNKQVRKVKKTMKHRFWTELYDGAKLFYLSGLQYGRYHRVEIQNLARFIAVQKVPLLTWRQSHPYVLALRWEDQTDPTVAETAPRRLDVYGYVYGGRLREGSEVHLPGVGDYHIASIKQLPDPCPPPTETEAERRRAANKKPDEKLKKNALRTLAERHRVVYAPGSDIGSITVDSEAMYIYVPDQQAGFTKEPAEEEGPSDDKDLPEAVRMVRALQGSEAALDKVSATRPGLRLLRNTELRLPEEVKPSSTEQGQAENGRRQRRPVPFGVSDAGQEDEESADGDDEEGDEGEEEEDSEGDDAEENDAEAHKRSFVERAQRRFAQAPRLEDVVYGTSTAGGSSGSRAPAPSSGSEVAKATDHKTVPLFEDQDDDDDHGRMNGDEKGQEPSSLLGNLGDLDGLDTARMPVLPGEAGPWDEERREALKARKFITGGWSSAEEDEGGEDEAAKETESKEPAEEGQEEAGAEPEEKPSTTSFESFSDSHPIATFVRVRLEDVPAACVAELRRERPIILGGLLPGESRMGMVQVRAKRHRWHPKLLKSNDALLLSVGWRRFQTVPTFSLEDRGEKRMRFLKYTLEHAHCTMTSYGPMVPPNTGILAFRSWEKVGHFRVCATGVVLESAPDFEVKKKLKLVGEPYKIFRNTAFVKNMFSSDLEVNKYSHAKIQTVSGIRGEIKKAEGTKGQFRATFEDRILMSDLVVCKCWINVPLKQFYHPVIDVPNWRPARLIGQLRADKGVPVPENRDSQYGKQFVRAERKFNALNVPKALEASLPFSARTKYKGKKKKSELSKKTAIVSSEKERAVNALMNRLYTVRKEKARVRQESNSKKKKVKEAREKWIQDKRDERSKEFRKKRHRTEGKQTTAKRKAMMMD
eukprot:TRINITY_DN39954_c0_g1_i1.p1 TRINITY_DN39954_c0_g1~~TRINITY_DN39954_c0_g1_i1.p1  ORF type:complete len:1065 (-),score=283.57 TRINITY_DN39954_c0_g1_i1:88-2859(-)